MVISFYICGNGRSCFIIRHQVHALIMLDFCSRDQTPKRLKLQVAGIWLEAIFILAYFLFNSLFPSLSKKLEKLEQYYTLSKRQLIISMDTNAYHTVGGTSDINKNVNFVNCLISSNLKILNRDDDFCDKACKEVIEITVGFSCTSPQIAR